MAKVALEEGFSWEKIDQLALSKEEIRRYGQKDEEIFYLRYEDKTIHGPFHLPSLSEALKQHPSWRKFKICPLKEDYWIPLHNHPIFDERQKRRLEEIKSLNQGRKDLYCLDSSGQELGSFSMGEVKKKVALGEILPTDLISLNKGESWIRLFEIERFNRRKSKAKKLPRVEGGKKLDTSPEVASRIARNNRERRRKSDAMIDLAHFEKIRAGKATVKGEGDKEQGHQKSSWKDFLPLARRSFWIGILMLVLIGPPVAFVLSVPKMFKTAEMAAKKQTIDKNSYSPPPKRRPAQVPPRPVVKNPLPTPKKKLNRNLFKFKKSRPAPSLPQEEEEEIAQEVEDRTPSRIREREMLWDSGEEDEEFMVTDEGRKRRGRHPSSLEEEELGELARPDKTSDEENYGEGEYSIFDEEIEF